MPRVVLPVYSVSRFVALENSATPATALDQVNGNVADNDGFTYMQMNLSGGVARTVTVAVPSGFDLDLPISSRSYPLPSNGVYRTGVFPVSVYGPQLLIDVSGANVAVRLFTLRTAL